MTDSPQDSWTARLEAYGSTVFRTLRDADSELLANGVRLAHDAPDAELPRTLAVLASVASTVWDLLGPERGLEFWSARVSVARARGVSAELLTRVEGELEEALDRIELSDYHRVRADHPGLDDVDLATRLAWAASTQRLDVGFGAYVDIVTQGLGEGRVELAREVWGRAEALAPRVRPAVRSMMYELVEQAVRNGEQGEPLVDVNALLRRLEPDVHDRASSVSATLVYAVVLCDLFGLTADAERLRAWTSYLDALQPQLRTLDTAWTRAHDLALECGDRRLVELVLEGAPDAAAAQPPAQRRGVPKTVLWVKDEVLPREASGELVWGGGESATLLHPLDPGARPHLGRVAALLEEIGVVGDHTAGNQGPRFSEWMQWRESKPPRWEVVQRDRIRIEAPRGAERPVVLVSNDVDPPTCPACGAFVGPALEIHDRLEETVGKAMLACPGCQERFAVHALDWGHWLGVASTWVWLADFDPGLGRPSDALLATLEEATGTAWTWTWLPKF